MNDSVTPVRSYIVVKFTHLYLYIRNLFFIVSLLLIVWLQFKINPT